jgi:hypothetical protein
MKQKGIFFCTLVLPITLAVIILALAGCSIFSPGTVTMPGVVISSPSPVAASPEPALTTYPGPGAVYPPMPGDDPQPGDDSYTRASVSIDLDSSQVIATRTDPSIVYVFLDGTLPGPCQVLRVVTSPPDSSSTINIDAYSLLNPYLPCQGGPNPFSTTVYLGHYPSWDHVVRVNGEQLVETARTYAPQPGDGSLTRAEITIDMSSTRLDTTGTQPDFMAVDLYGTLPDSCHQLRIEPVPSGSDNKVTLDVYSVFDAKSSCNPGTQPFHVVYPFGYTTGFYNVFVNGEFVGKFEWGG